MAARRPSPEVNDTEREAQIDNIVARLDRLEHEAERLRSVTIAIIRNKADKEDRPKS